MLRYSAGFRMVAYYIGPYSLVYSFPPKLIAIDSCIMQPYFNADVGQNAVVAYVQT